MKQRPTLPQHEKIPDDAKEVFSGRRYRVFQWEQKSFDGSYSTYEGIKRRDSVIILPVIGEEIVMVKERQPHWPTERLNLVAGNLEENEELEEGARREVKEETGMVFKDFFLVYFEKVASEIDWYLYTFVAKDLLETGEKNLDPGERSEVVRHDFSELMKMARNKELHYRARMVEDFILRDKIDEFFDLLRDPKKYEIKY